jgi:putative protease
VNRKLELVAPAGNLACARAAVANGADAIYFGLQQFNARMRADNFTVENLPELVQFVHAHGVRAFCALNTLIFTAELPAAEAELLALDAAGVDAVIVQDLGIARLAQRLGVRLAVHASTQMTITSPEGVAVVERLGIQRVVLARETSLPELAKFPPRAVALECFVHGALCVAYSGQCLTSEALGQRSANRGECAQACRLPYDLIVDGAVRDLGDRRYLLSPQDLAAVREIPELIRLGVTGFKIEGRLKTPEYVAATCQVYRQAMDAATGEWADADRYKLEMAFSRGFYSGWLHGVNHQQLVHARFGTKRGAFVGWVTGVGPDHVVVQGATPVKAGDGVVFDTGGDPDHEQGGRVWQVRDGALFFERGHLDFRKIQAGHRVWKTSDPQLTKELRKSFTGAIPKPKRPLDLVVTGKAGGALCVEAQGVRVHSAVPLQIAYKRPLNTPTLRDQLGRLGETEFVLRELTNRLTGQVILPVSELNRLRRELVEKLMAPPPAADAADRPALGSVLAQVLPTRQSASGPTELIALCRSLDQIRAALDTGVGTIYVDFEDLRRYPEAVALTRSRAQVFLATPRIQKAGERGFFKMVEEAGPDGVLIRNLGGLDYFRDRPLRKVGDFSLNVANPLTADWLVCEGLERVTVAYDCNAQQVLDLLNQFTPAHLEIVVHQHLPMFHMEHCVFAAFLSTGKDYTDCGRPCDRHQLQLRDRVGVEHPVLVDVGCRNTVYHARAQSGVDFYAQFHAAGARVFRVELLDEDAAQAGQILRLYRDLLAGQAPDLKSLRAVRQLGVTSGTLTVLGAR